MWWIKCIIFSTYMRMLFGQLSLKSQTQVYFVRRPGPVIFYAGSNKLFYENYHPSLHFLHLVIEEPWFVRMNRTEMNGTWKLKTYFCSYWIFRYVKRVFSTYSLKIMEEVKEWITFSIMWSSVTFDGKNRRKKPLELKKKLGQD